MERSSFEISSEESGQRHAISVAATLEGGVEGSYLHKFGDLVLTFKGDDGEEVATFRSKEGRKVGQIGAHYHPDGQPIGGNPVK